MAFTGNLVIQFYPPSLAVLLAVAAAALSFKYPTVGMLFAFLQVAPAYEYQFSFRFGGAWGIMLLGVMIFLSFYASGLARTGFHRLVGAGAGAVAAYLMATPLYFASVPLLLVLAAWYKNAAKATALSIFLANYLPLLLLASSWTSASAPLPLYSQISNLAPRFEAVDLEKMSLQILGFGATASGAVRFVDSALGLLRRAYAPVLFIALTIFSIFTSYHASWLIALLKAKGLFPKNLEDYSRIFSAFIGWAIFIVPLLTLQFALTYSVESFGLLSQSGSIIVLSVGSMTTSWLTVSLTKRTQLIRFREDVLSLIANLKKRIDSSLSTIKKAEQELAAEGLSEPKVQAEALGNKVNLIYENYSGLENKDLEDKLKDLVELNDTASSLDDLLRQKLKEAYNGLFEYYTTALNMQKELGVQAACPPVLAEPLQGMSIDEVIAAYAALQQTVKEVTEDLVKSTRELSDTVRTMFDPGFQDVTAEMASDFLKQSDYTNAIQSSVETIREAMAKIALIVADSLERSNSIARELADIVNNQLTVLAHQLDEEDFARNILMLGPFTEKVEDIGPSRSACDIFSLSRIKHTLPVTMSTIVKSIDDILLKIENEVDAKIPQNFNWNKDLEVHLDVTKFLKTIEDQQEIPGFEFVESCSSGLELVKRLTERFDTYLDMLAFTSSYRYVEKMIAVKLAKSSVLATEDLKVRMAPDFLKLYALHHDDTFFDNRSKKLLHRKKPSRGREIDIG